MANWIPEPHAGYAARVCELVNVDTQSLRDQISQKARLSDSYATRLVEDPTIICVAGERGSGKTTVLAAVAAQLKADGHVVVPPVRPEYFAAAGSLIPTVVAHLRTTVVSDWSGRGRRKDPGSDPKMARDLERTLRQANLLSYGHDVDVSTLRADEQAADRSLAQSADSNFLDNWRKLITQVQEMAAGRSKRTKLPLVVVPVDDPDLAPGTLRQILLDLRLITSVDGVVGITCLDLEEARSVLNDAYIGSYHKPPNRMLTGKVVEAQIAKAFPDDRRVNIAALGADHRLSFRALDLSLPSIEKLCAAHRIGGDYGKDTVASVLRMPRSKEPSPYAEALPSYPRDLRAFAYRLSCSAADSSTGVGEAAMEFCRSAMETGLKQSGANEPEFWPAGMPFEVLDKQVNGLPSCALRFDEIAIRGERRTERSLPGSKEDEGTVSVRLGYDSGVQAHLVRRGKKPETVQRLDPSFTYALLLVREFQHYYGVIHADISGSVPARGGNNSANYLIAHIDGQPTDDRFLSTPAWEAYYDYFALDEALSEAIVTGTSAHNLSDSRLAVEAYCIDFCRNILSVQVKRSPARNPARVSTAVREGSSGRARKLLDRELARFFREVDECLDATEGRVCGADGVRGADFRRWIEVGIVNMCHSRLLTPGFIKKLLSHREGVLGRRGWLQGADKALCSVLESRIKSALDEIWVQPLIELLGRFDEELGGVLLVSHTRALETVQRSRQRLIAESALASPSLPSGELDQGRDDFEIALAVLEQLEGETRSAMLRSDR
jgi:RecA/RadA recombinase